MGNLYTPKYITVEDVVLELQGKVSFSDEDPQYISTPLVLDKIAKGESLVELEMSRVYMIPFQGFDGTPFADIPDTFYSSKQYISTMALLQSCIFIMDSYFGRTEGTRGEAARKNYLSRISELKKGIMDKEDVTYYWKNPPLPGLMLNYDASWANAALPAPANAVIGATDFNKQMIQNKLTNPNSNWWVPNVPWTRYGAWPWMRK